MRGQIFLVKKQTVLAIKLKAGRVKIMKKEVFVYLKKGEITLWQKHHIWHKWKEKTPKAYADAMFKITKNKSEYGPCFWGMHEESPEEKGYVLLGTLNLKE